MNAAASSAAPEPTGAHADFASLAGRTAVVTGSSRGIGRAIAAELARAGADVVVHGHANRSGAEETAELVRSCGRSAAVLLEDLGDESRLDPFVEAVTETLGRVDVWINNAGVDLLTGADSRLDYEAKLRRLFEVDVRSTVLLSRIVGERMRAAGGGVILNIGWDQADRGMEGDSGELFAVSKNAVMGFTRSLAVSLAPEVRVNCIAPGWIRTAWGETASQTWQDRVRRETPLDRWGTPEDVAKMARFLASDEAAFVTGQVVNVNGGAVR